MKFKEIVEGLDGAKNSGYTFDEHTETTIDKELYHRLSAERGKKWTDNKIDALYDFDSPLYEGEDGKMYAVEFVYVNNEYKPLAWHELKQVEEET